MQREKKVFISLRSVTYAYRARDILAKNGIKSYIERIPENLRKEGCGYGIALYRDAEQAETILKQHGIVIKRIVR